MNDNNTLTYINEIIDGNFNEIVWDLYYLFDDIKPFNNIDELQNNTKLLNGDTGVVKIQKEKINFDGDILNPKEILISNIKNITNETVFCLYCDHLLRKYRNNSNPTSIFKTIKDNKMIKNSNDSDQFIKNMEVLRDVFGNESNNSFELLSRISIAPSRIYGSEGYSYIGLNIRCFFHSEINFKG